MLVWELGLSLGFLLCTSAYGQGSIVARSSTADMAPECQGGYLPAGDWALTVGYRHQFSYKHFVGGVEQTYRVQQGTDVMNKINFEDIADLPDDAPVHLTLSVPMRLASRRANNSYCATTASGLGDTSLVFQGWLWNPRRARRGTYGDAAFADYAWLLGCTCRLPSQRHSGER